ncbi:hypothetical protein PYCC9005_002115 [Savitreella phatthalungensis]
MAASLSSDLQKLTSLPQDKHALYVFNTLSTHHRHLCLLDATILVASSQILLDELGAATRATGLNKANRALLSRCYLVVFRRMAVGPFEPTSRLLQTLGKEKDEKIRTALLSILLNVFETFGRDMLSLLPELAAICLKATKSTSNAVRCHGFRALAAGLQQVEPDENIARDVYRAIRQCVPDKSNAVCASALLCLEAILRHADLDIAHVIKALEHMDSARVRRAAAKCLATREIRRFSGEFVFLSTLYNKSSSRRTRTIVALTYEEMLMQADVTWIAQHWETLLLSLVNDLQMSSIETDPFKALGARAHVQLLLRRFNRALDQEHQLLAIKRLILHVRTAPSRYILVSCLEEVASLIEMLGCAAPQNFEMDALMFVVSHPTAAVHVAAAHAVKTICLNVPSLLSNFIAAVFTQLKETDQEQEMCGLSLALGALLTASVRRPLYVSLDSIAAQVFDFATSNLKVDGREHVAWILIAALQSLGPSFVRSHLSQLLLLWKNALPRGGEGSEWALTSVYCFLRQCRSLLTADVAKRVATLVGNCIQTRKDDLRRRTLQCLLELNSHVNGGATAMDDCISLALTSFANPAPSKDPMALVTIATAADNYRSGLSSLAAQGLSLEVLNSNAILPALEHDYLAVLQEIEASPSSSTQCIDLGIQLFRMLYPKQSPQVQASLLAQAQQFLSKATAARKQALLTNLVLGFETESFKEAMSSSDSDLRNLAGAALGKAVSTKGSAHASAQVDELVDRIVNDRDPNTRAGCTIALGHIHAALGGIAARYHLKRILNVLVSLAADPHPTVHLCALQALARTISSSGLNFAQHTSSTLALLLRLYTSDLLDETAGSTATSNLAFDNDATSVLAECADGLINLLGPDLEDSATSRDLLVKLVGEVLQDPSLVAVGLRCSQHLALFAPRKIDMTSYILSLHFYLKSHDDAIRNATVDGLYQLVRVDANQVIQHSSISSRFDTAIWTLLNADPSCDTVKDIILAWLLQTQHEYNYWVDLFGQIIIRQRLTEVDRSASAARELSTETRAAEDEGASLEQARQEARDAVLRWQTCKFAIKSLAKLISVLAMEHLANRVADLVRIAFTAATSPVEGLRIEGLTLLNLLIERLKTAADPEFPEQPLLEQYQAQLASALTPAFGADAPPAVTASAIHVCAVFISSGIVRDVERMSRVVRMLSGSLDEAAYHGMLRTAALAAWARLQVMSIEQDYLRPILSERLHHLLPLWLDALKDYARLKFEPTSDLFTSVSRETTLTFYDRAWLNIVHAVATLLDIDRAFVFNVLGEKSSDDIDYRGEPAAFFMVLFGICYESLAHASLEGRGNYATLQALRSILSPSVCGDVVFSEPIFTELTDLFGRLLLTEGVPSQLLLVDTIHMLGLSHPNTSSNLEQGFVDQMFDLARLTILPLTIVFSWDQSEQGKEVTQIDASLPKLARTCLAHFVDLTERFPPIIRLDLYNAMFHVFGNVFQALQTQATVVPAILPPFRAFCAKVSATLHEHGQNGEVDAGMLVGPARYILRKLVTAQEDETVNNRVLASTILANALVGALQPQDKLFAKHATFVVRALSNAASRRSAEWACKTTYAAHPIVARLILTELTRHVLDDPRAGGALLSLLFDLLETADLPALIPLVLLFVQANEVNELKIESHEANENTLITINLLSRLLDHVRDEPVSFKMYVSQMPLEQRAMLQSFILRLQGKQAGDKDSAPQISLRTAFA